jgi:hypothetical protein
MSLLSREDRVRYARQISLPEIGEAGQLRLAQTRVQSSHPVTSLYLERAGLEVIDSPSAVLPISVEAGHPALHEAAELLRGALGAVEALKAALGIGAALPREVIQLKEHSS